MLKYAKSARMSNDFSEKPEIGFRKFCQNTTLHGWAYLDRESGIIRRAIWLTFLIVVGATSIFYFYQNYQQVNIFIEHNFGLAVSQTLQHLH